MNDLSQKSLTEGIFNNTHVVKNDLRRLTKTVFVKTLLALIEVYVVCLFRVGPYSEKNCERRLENTARGRRSRLFAMRTDSNPANNLFMFSSLALGLGLGLGLTFFSQINSLILSLRTAQTCGALQMQ